MVSGMALRMGHSEHAEALDHRMDRLEFVFGLEWRPKLGEKSGRFAGEQGWKRRENLAKICFFFSDSDNCEWKCRRILQTANVLLYGAFQVLIKSFLFGHF
jgi:hypothetical protein